MSNVIEKKHTKIDLNLPTLKDIDKNIHEPARLLIISIE